MLLELLAASAGSGSRLFNYIRYAGTGGVRAVAVGVEPPAMALVTPVSDVDDRAVYDTVRGASSRIKIAVANEDIAGAFAFSGKDRVYTGTLYNGSGVDYDSFHFAARPRFMDIVTFNGGATGIAHALTEAPTFALILRRTGSTGPLAVLGIIGAGEFTIPTQSPPTSGEIFTAVSGAAFTPNSAWSLVGNTYVAYLFSGGLTRVATGSYVGTVPFNDAGGQAVPLAFAPAIVILWGPFADLAPAGLLYTVTLVYGLNNRPLVDSIGHIHSAIVGTDLQVGSDHQPVNPNASSSACIDGETYRYVAIR